MVVINALFFLQYRNEQEYVIENAFRVFHESTQILDLSRSERLSFGQARQRLHDILDVEMLYKEEAGSFYEGRLLRRHRELSIYAYEQMVYLYFDDRLRDVRHYLRYRDDRLDDKRIIIVAFAIDIAVALFFLYVVRRIWPLHGLRRSISDLAQGRLDMQTKIKGKDEIAALSDEFDKAIGTIRHLQASRNLFLRNIMHELKTPIAKGRLITDLLDDTKNAERLGRLFDRLEHLLGEFAKIERVTSNELRLEKKPFRIVDILDNALDILMIERDVITTTIRDESEIEADFEMFSIALKNLIDNALRYGSSRPDIIIDKDSIEVDTKGERLDEALFTQVFNRRFEESSKGLGLGLYIAKSIIERHGMRLEYLHEDGLNRFIILHRH